MRLALFDLDHTLLPIDSADSWSYHVVRRGKLDRAEYEARIRGFARDYHAGSFDVEGYLAFQMGLLARFPYVELERWHAEFLDDIVRPNVRPEALALVNEHRRCGDELALVTGTNAFVVTPIAREFGIEHVLAVEPERRDGEFTGRYLGTHTYQDGKVRKVDDWLKRRGTDWNQVETIFYSDSINDLPLLERVTRPVVTNGDKKISQVARERGWPMLQLFPRAA